MFDSVPLSRLLGKPEYYGVRDNLLKWSESFLVGRSQSVLVNRVKSGSGKKRICGCCVRVTYRVWLHLVITDEEELDRHQSLVVQP